MTNTQQHRIGDMVRIGKGAVDWRIESIWADGTVTVARTTGVGRLGRWGRTVRHSFGPQGGRPLSALTPLQRGDVATGELRYPLC